MYVICVMLMYFEKFILVVLRYIFFWLIVGKKLGEIC